jgi:hypothetical protein
MGVRPVRKNRILFLHLSVFNFGPMNESYLAKSVRWCENHRLSFSLAQSKLTEGAVNVISSFLFLGRETTDWLLKLLETKVFPLVSLTVRHRL